MSSSQREGASGEEASEKSRFAWWFLDEVDVEELYRTCGWMYWSDPIVGDWRGSLSNMAQSPA
jgi:hypothetical protein